MVKDVQSLGLGLRDEGLRCRDRGGLVFKAHRLVYHATLGSRVIKKKKKRPGGRRSRRRWRAASAPRHASPAAGSYLRLLDSCITQLKAQGPSRTCN